MKPLQGFLGARPEKGGVRFGVYAPDATAVSVCLFDAHDHDRQTATIALLKGRNGIWTGHAAGIGAGQRYGLRADGPYDPHKGHWFDPAKLLVDPFATRLDRPFAQHADLRAPREHATGTDTAPLVPKAIVEAAPAARGGHISAPAFRPGGMVYELNVRGFTKLHPDVPEAERGTLAALGHPALIAHLKRIGAAAVELLPLAAWIDEPHLGPLGLRNAWGYNPVAFMAPDPRLAPNGIADLRKATDALRAEGISTILDVVFNHTGEGDRHGATLSLRGLAGARAFRHGHHDELVNNTGTGNTLACDDPFVMRLVLDSLRHLVAQGGVDGFRFDLATVLGRTSHGFRPDAPLLAAICADAVLKTRILIAEPWDIGPGGYQLGNFPAPFLELADRYRDDMRMFWRGDPGKLGVLATRLAGSSDIYAGHGATRTRTVNFIAAHDGFTLADLVAYERKHNEANGERNRDGHNENYSWNNGAEGPVRDREIAAARDSDVRALLSTLFASRGTVFMQAGDEFGRTQNGNNNAYAQDNEISWVNWAARDHALEEHVARLAAIRRDWPHLCATSFFLGEREPGSSFADVTWLHADGTVIDGDEWNVPGASALTMVIAHPDIADGPRLATIFNRGWHPLKVSLPQREKFGWTALIEGPRIGQRGAAIAARTVAFFGETAKR